MAAGDARFFEANALANNGFLDLDTAGVAETVIHNCGGGGAWELYYWNGTNSIGPLHVAIANEVLMNVQLHGSDTKYYRIKNVSGGTAHFFADGMDTG